MVRASTLALHLNTLECVVGLEFLSMAHPRAALFAFVPTMLTGPLRGTVTQTVRSSAGGAFMVSLFGSLLVVCGLASVLKLRDRTTRVGEKWFALTQGALALNCFAFKDRIPGVFPLFTIAHAAIAILFHLGDDVVVPLKFPSVSSGGGAKTKRAGAGKPAKKSSSKKTPSRASSRKSSRK